ncbi:DUF5125 domain-containing protein [Natronoflexus pectinivorans]|uniref:Uncharacterized protein DUF5016 n=1 Tax=Natronoflexus pectinivorans TaxID=682526 RepID=A0A4R2GMQ5_9BACT|nr:DUF5125 domain-containing protein [Natronoflexus pectinivorans]TCO09709.1 uncharacterized protein DUF5016 [Natronoflexus pectinivorans]
MIRNILKAGALFFSLMILTSCDDDKEVAGNPELTVNTEIVSAHFGDSIQFNVTVNDDEVPLSTVKAQLFFGDEMVEETVIRTKENGQYHGVIFVPFLKNIPNGTATMRFVLQNIRFAVAQQSFDVALTRADYPYLTLITDDQEYEMSRVGLYQYAASASFPQKVSGYIKAPVVSEWGNEITFGWSNGEISEGVTNLIHFSNYAAGEYDIEFNTFTYAAAPFISLEFAGIEMAMIDEDNYRVELNLDQNQDIELGGIADIEEWWIDEDFFTLNSDNTLTFLPVSGRYRVTANFNRRYFIVEAMTGNNLSTLQADGGGAIWIIGTDIGKPSLSNEVGWNTDKALCMAQVSPNVYQVTVVAGESMNNESINFKFFHQKGWGGEFSNTTLTTESDIIFVGDGENGRDPGNLGLMEGVILPSGNTYVITIDVNEGIENAVMYVTEK